MVVTISHSGYIQAHVGLHLQETGRRGGRGLSGQGLKDEDFVELLFIASTHEYLLVFTDDGRCFWLKVHEIPQAGRATKGKPVVNLINVTPETKVQSIVPVREFRDDQFLLFSTKKGTVKKTALSAYANPRSNGIKAIKIEDGDELMDVQITSGTNDIVLATRHGLSIRFHEQDVREMGRDTTGVKGIELGPRDVVIGMVVIQARSHAARRRREGHWQVLAHRRLPRAEARRQGHHHIHRTDKTGDAVSIMEVLPEDELMLMTKQGILIRMPVKGIRVAGRNTPGRQARQPRLERPRDGCCTGHPRGCRGRWCRRRRRVGR